MRLASPAPVLIICYDRPEKAALLLAHLRDVPNKLFLFCDGGGSEEFEALFAEVKAMRPEGATECLILEKNLGHRDGPWQAIQWFFSQVDAGIILEEDIMPAPRMLECYSRGLAAFADDKSVFALGSAPNKNVAAPGKESWTRSPLFLVWGWATWADRIKACELPNDLWKKHGKALLSRFETLGARLYLTREMWKLEANPSYCWSYYPQLHALANKLDILIPETKLTKNSGVGPSARRSKTNPDTRPDPRACHHMARKPSGANKACGTWQRKVEKIKFLGLIHELRNRLELGKLLRILNGS
jgi:hypothetical protein